MRHWRIYNLFMTTCYMYKITIIIIIKPARVLYYETLAYL